jgi:hypothetical protein
MRALFPTSAALLCALALSTSEAQAADTTNGRWLEPSVINANYASIDAAAFAPAQNSRAIYEHAFYTPQPNFEQNGYSCSPVVSVSFAGRTKHMHRGTYCIR